MGFRFRDDDNAELFEDEDHSPPDEAGEEGHGWCCSGAGDNETASFQRHPRQWRECRWQERGEKKQVDGESEEGDRSDGDAERQVRDHEVASVSDEDDGNGTDLDGTGEATEQLGASTTPDGEDWVNSAIRAESLRRAAYVFLTAFVADPPLAMMLSDSAREAALEASKLLWRIGEYISADAARELSSKCVSLREQNAQGPLNTILLYLAKCVLDSRTIHIDWSHWWPAVCRFSAAAAFLLRCSVLASIGKSGLVPRVRLRRVPTAGK